MPRITGKNIAALLGVFLLVWMGLKYLLPLGLPFLLGGLLALAAEPMVRLLHRRLHLPRGVSAGIGVALTLVLLSCVLVLLTALLVRELGLLAGALPDLEQTARSGLSTLEGFLLELTQRMPQGVRPLVSQSVTQLFSGGSAIVDRVVQQLPSMASAVLGRVPDSALALGTGILSGFMVSARLPGIRDWLRGRPFAARLARYTPVLKQVRAALGGWLKAQLKLSGLSFLIVGAGFLLLRIPYAPLWALITAIVDAIPVLGTGTVLLPWALVCLVQGQTVRAVGLLGIYVTALLSRTVLEPRLVGRQLGLDPLMTLIALYAGYKIWGIGGMLLSPVLCVTARELARARQ